MERPLVSIVIPAYNQRPEFLIQSIKSALSQTYQNIEIIVSDNHSTNETAEVLKTFNDSRLNIIRPPQHLPLTPHFQWASEHAKGEFISFLPSDDWMENECIEELVRIIQQGPGIVMAFCSVKQFYNGKKADFINLVSEVSESEEEIQAYARISKQKGFFVASMYRKSVYDSIGGIGDGDLAFASDRWLYMQMAIHGDGAYSNKPYGIHRNENPNRNSRMYLYSVDVVKFFELIEEKYLSKVRGGVNTLNKERNIMASRFLHVMPQNYRAGHIKDEEFEKTMDNIRKMSSSGITHFFAGIIKKKRFLGAFSLYFFLMNKTKSVFGRIRRLLSKRKYSHS